MNRVARRAGISVALILVLVCGLVFFLYEYGTKANTWVKTPGSIHISNGPNLDSGIVTDRNGTMLLDLRGDRTYCQDLLLRSALVHWLGDRNGNVNAPAIPSYADEILNFSMVNGLYNYGEKTGVVTTTFSAEAQKVALEAMQGYKGTVAVYNYRTGELVCAVSTPTYDPDNEPDISTDTEGKYEGLYLNRFVQSAYTPGSIFKIVTLAAALETIPDLESRSFVCTGSYKIGADEVTCDGDVHWDQTLKTAFRNSCNCVFAQIALELGPETLARFGEQFGITKPITFDGLTTATGNFEVQETADVNVAWAAIGQYNDLINPCAFLTYMGAIAGGGKGAIPYFVEQVAVGDEVTYDSALREGEEILSEKTAEKLREYMAFNVQDKYGSENFPGLTVCAKTGTAEVGGDKKPNAMLAGFVADEEYPLAFIVCVEDAGYGKTVCIPIASKVLASCKAALDQE